MGTEIEFVGFAADCRVEGKVDLEDARLADLLNRQSSVFVHDVVAVSTSDGHRRELEMLEIERDELDLVVASGPRGDPRRRLATRPVGVTMTLGPYCTEGFMHGPATANPVRGINHLPAMVAITDAVLEYLFCNERVSESFRTVLVNRDMASSLRALANPGVQQTVATAPAATTQVAATPVAAMPVGSAAVANGNVSTAPHAIARAVVLPSGSSENLDSSGPPRGP